MIEIHEGEVWFVEFPYEEDETKFSNRPVIVLDVDTLSVLSVKVTKHIPRWEDPYDVPIVKYTEAGLRLSSTARVSKVMNLNKDNFLYRLGNLHPDDLDEIAESYIKYIGEQKKSKIQHENSNVS